MLQKKKKRKKDDDDDDDDVKETPLFNSPLFNRKIKRNKTKRETFQERIVNADAVCVSHRATTRKPIKKCSNGLCYRSNLCETHSSGFTTDDEIDAEPVPRHGSAKTGRPEIGDNPQKPIRLLRSAPCPHRPPSRRPHRVFRTVCLRLSGILGFSVRPQSPPATASHRRQPAVDQRPSQGHDLAPGLTQSRVRPTIKAARKRGDDVESQMAGHYQRITPLAHYDVISLQQPMSHLQAL